MKFPMKKLAVALAAASTLIVSTAANAYTINFDESPATNNNVAYGATIFGATFSATNAGTWGGNSNGNPGNWGLEGTNGPNFLGFNGNGGYSETVTFASSISNISLDFSRSNGSIDGTIALSAYNGATLVGTTTATLGTINTWSSLSLSAPVITSITWAGTGAGFHPYGVDNITAAVPEPETYAMLLAGLGLMGFMVRRKKSV